ncbi:hypothetical protein YUYDRAFT_02121 [Streptomyces sp. ScaeMP-e48]|uniref:hypothetical protein n=1 Tax=Streptomyces sp. ScaeMP-e48 TaxID=1100823 RepID=UPI0008239031|nr:hypothetical protein [Streptomyces sp. ScaeMP-e48]SCK20351.1 hypothetical protein YUYDRAFT_02121 [Streptomyces sp. ScaeMP-e48]
MSGYPLPGGRHITGVLTTTFGRQLKGGTWAEHPKAKYECLLCRTTEGPVVGAAAVTAFNQTIRLTHPTNCHPDHATQQGAHAA